MQPRLLARLATIALLLASTLCQAQNAQFDYRDLQRAAIELQSIPDARYLRPGLRLSGRGFSRRERPAVLTVKAIQQDYVLRVDPNGNFDLPNTPQLREENPQVWTNINLSLGKLDFQSTIRVEAPALREFDYQLIGAMREEFRRSRGLMSRFFSPSIRGVLIDFGAAGNYRAVVNSAGATQNFDSDADGYLRLPLTDGLINSRATVNLSAMPAAIRLEME